LTCIAALILGGWRERSATALYLLAVAANYGLGLLVLDMTTQRLLFSDTLCLIGFFCLCWKAPHPWPLWAAGLQLLAVMTEVSVLFMSTGTLRWTLLTVVALSGYGVLLVLWIGTFAAARRRFRVRSQSVAESRE
jgi:hypothetical protein